MSAAVATAEAEAADFTGDFAAALRGRQADAAERVARSGYRDPIAAHLRTLAHAEADGTAAYADPNAACKSFDPETATARFLITTSTEDRYGDVVEPRGCEARLGRYRANPVVFFGHKSYGLPVGSSVDKAGNFGFEFADAGIVSAVKFHLKTKESEDVCRLVEARELRAASIGFLPVRAKVVKVQPDPEDDERPKNERTFEPYLKYRFVEWEMLEWSVVAVPANPDCVAMRLSRGFAGAPLAPAVARYLEPFAAQSRAWSPGWQAPAVAAVPEFRAAPAPPPVSAPAPAFDPAAFRAEVAGEIRGQLEGFRAALLKDLAASPAAPAVPPAVPPAAPPAAPGQSALLAQIVEVKRLAKTNTDALRRVTGRVD